MRLLLDTHLLVWASAPSVRPQAMSRAARDLINDLGNELHFSAVSVWEVAIKTGRGRDSFVVDPQLFRRGLLDNGYIELPITSAHAAGVSVLAPIHKDPFDRLLIAQASAEGLTLVTADTALAEYNAPIHLV